MKGLHVDGLGKRVFGGGVNITPGGKVGLDFEGMPRVKGNATNSFMRRTFVGDEMSGSGGVIKEEDISINMLKEKGFSKGGERSSPRFLETGNKTRGIVIPFLPKTFRLFDT